MDVAEYRERSFQIWERMAPGWDQWRDYLWRFSRPIGEWLVEAIEPQPGQTILEVAAGIGETGFVAAELIGDEGRLISTDFSPRMVDAASRRGAELGIDNAEYRVLDVQNMDELGDDSVDGVLCRWGYMLMEDPAAALAETRRVLRSGGRVAFAVWATPDLNPFLSIPAWVLIRRGHMPAPEPGAPGMFALSDHERVQALVTGAGFGPPRIERVPITWRFRAFEEMWQFMNEIAGPLALVVEGLSDEEKEGVRRELKDRSGMFSLGGGYELPGLSLNVVAS